MPNRSLLAAALAFLSACAAGPRAASSRFAPVAAPEARPFGSRPAAAPLRMRDVVASAWRAADAVAAAGDANAIAGMFAPDAQLVRAAGDTLRGREAIAAWLSASLPPAARLRFRFNRVEQLVECADWAVEEGVLSAWRRGAALDDSVVTPIGLRWTRASDSTARVSFATLDAPAARALRRTTRCRANTVVRSNERRRWIVSISPDGPTLVRAGDGHAAMTDRLDEGWSNGESANCDRCPRAERGAGSILPLLSYAGVRYRGQSRFGFEAFLLEQHDELYRFYYYQPTLSVRIRYDKSGYLAGALVNLERSFFRIGVGPAYSASRWRLDERRYSVPAQTQDLSDDITSIGAVAQVAFQFPFHERIAIDARAQWFHFGSATMRGTTYFGEVPYDPSGPALTFGLGVPF